MYLLRIFNNQYENQIENNFFYICALKKTEAMIHWSNSKTHSKQIKLDTLLRYTYLILI